MNRPVLLLYGLVTYALFNITFLYFAGFLVDFGVPKAVNDGDNSLHLSTTILINLGLVFLFGFFHSLMARERFKKWWVRKVSSEAERSTYVLQASLFLALLMWQWRPLPETLWQIDGWYAIALYMLFAVGVAIVLISTFLINHFELFGLQQVWYAQSGRQLPEPTFVTPLLYRVVRHPMQLGVIIALFSTPHMTVGHLLFSMSMSAYVLIGLYFEERSLVRTFGDRYKHYQSQVPMLIPLPGRRLKQSIATSSN